MLRTLAVTMRDMAQRKKERRREILKQWRAYRGRDVRKRTNTTRHPIARLEPKNMYTFTVDKKEITVEAMYALRYCRRG